MKFLISLILILSIVYNNCNAFSLNKNSNKKVLDYDICFPSGSTGINGFRTNILGVGYNSLYPNGDGAISSYIEENQIDVDFENQRLFANYFMKLDGNTENIFGSFWAFSSNKTEYYYIVDNDGVYNCYSSEMDYEISANFELDYVSENQIGATPCEVYHLKSNLLQNTTIQSIIVDKSQCALTASILTMVSPASTGVTLVNYFNYNPSSNPINYELPVECGNPVPINQVIRPRSLNLFKQH
ncbi:hypothetical protein DDB_G0291706 [Dictyostelium discoideum AX4]|uniref:Uncharacterized protein n=1 Tax=Dictyostelium discoideum TaxID=44689 RepID=Q54EA2_DICDI|nr:hypothetical protein DDB_G0291706 [Dictyostelium discoideum AX4]EAL61589.1 hypothetical protein DDB_G0291706 [Dictyostelium discoideum AX4]|eukprot:XP_630000.1 hypothetical protein DDB_G0291706 [Dictyostelium discoideum AX4]